MIANLIALGVLFALATASVTYPAAPPLFDGKSFTKWQARRSGKSRLGSIHIPFTAEDGSDDFVEMKRLDLVGDSKARGFDHGYLLAKDIIQFVEVGLNKYYMDMVLNLSFDTSNLPKALQDIFSVIKVKGALAAPAVFNAAFAW